MDLFAKIFGNVSSLVLYLGYELLVRFKSRRGKLQVANLLAQFITTYSLPASGAEPLAARKDSINPQRGLVCTSHAYTARASWPRMALAVLYAQDSMSRQKAQKKSSYLLPKIDIHWSFISHRRTTWSVVRLPPTSTYPSTPACEHTLGGTFSRVCYGCPFGESLASSICKSPRDTGIICRGCWGVCI